MTKKHRRSDVPGAGATKKAMTIILCKVDGELEIPIGPLDDWGAFRLCVGAKRYKPFACWPVDGGRVVRWVVPGLLAGECYEVIKQCT